MTAPLVALAEGVGAPAMADGGSALTVVLALLAAVALLAAIGQRIAIPGPVVFALGGLALALVPGLPPVALPPTLVLVVFLPPLIFAAAQDTSWGELRAAAWPITLLAVGLVLVTMGAVAVVARAFAPELPWAVALTLGAIVAPPDTVAAKAVADTLHLPRRLVTILEGEGLVNDATALVAVRLTIAAAIAATASSAAGGAVAGAVAGAAAGTGTTGETAADASALLAPWLAALLLGAARLVGAAAGGVAIGLAVGWVGHRVHRRAGDPAVGHVVMGLLPFAAFLPAERVHASGVMAVLALALYLGRHGTRVEGAVDRLEGRVLWDTLAFLLTGLSFVLVGLQLRPAFAGLVDRAAGLRLTGAVCVTVMVVRPLWVFGTAWGSHAVRRRVAAATETGVDAVGAGGAPGVGAVAPPLAPPAVATLAVLGWAGMRGVVSLAVALSLPLVTADGRPFPGRALLVFVTFGVVLVTLVGQGLTLPWVIRRLGLRVPPGRAERQQIAAELGMARVALAQLDTTARTVGATAPVVDALRARYLQLIGSLEGRAALQEAAAGDGAAALAADTRARAEVEALVLPLLALEHAELQRRRAGDDLDAPVARRVQTDLDARRAPAHRARPQDPPGQPHGESRVERGGSEPPPAPRPTRER